MKISYNWLKEFININISPEKLAEVLTMHSFEVENIIYQGEGLNSVVVGEVLEIKKHPDADKLNLVKVDVGDSRGLASSVEAKPLKSAILNIVCGAPNVEAGQKVAVALVGAELPGEFKIEKRKVRGVDSYGMICAEDELGLGDDHEGIMVLDKNLEVGTPLKEALNLDDVIFEIDILPNRAHDCLSHIGVAREVAAMLKKSIKYQVASIKQDLKESSLSIKVEEKNLCKRYSAVAVKDVEIKDSPVWLKNKLESCGVRHINNVVDITNFVMLSYGQPMHAFDADKLNGKIIIRKAKKGEKILALDEETYKLNENDLVIADEKNPIAIAGVMGGMETAVDEGTKNIIFEAANFDCTNIRKTAKRLKLSSESSYRFEREIDPEMTMPAITKAIEMAGDLAGGKAEENIIDIYPNPAKQKELEFEFERIKNLLGVEVAEKEVMRILESLDFEVAINNKILKIKVPTCRIDIEKTNDIIEEIGRIYGYENIPEVAPTVEMKSVASDKILSLEKDLRVISEGLGFCEIYNYSFVSEKDINNLGLKIEDHLELQNPLSEEHKFMRMSVLPYLLKNVEKNLKYRDDFALFELGRVYLKRCWLHSPHRSGAVEPGCEPLAHGLHSSVETMEPTLLPDEKRIFAGIVADKNIKDTLFYELKGRVEILLSKLGVGELSFQEIKSAESFWHKGRSSEIVYKNKTIGKIGEIHPNVSNAFGIETRVSYFEIYEEELLEFYSKEKNFQKINKFPAIELDLSVVFDEGVEWDDVKKVVFNAGGELIKSVEPFDIYRGKEIGYGKKSIAFRIFYQAEDRTLKDEEVGVVQEKVVGGLGKMGGEVRK
ncbi:phenylalanine--tRNA ligase subunit beta [Candidatus Parcubacteria bacterium]|nr:phenylalanine--tRNA ligase subunit beta [Candidatus Parcubacteria bacterium]